MHKKCADRWRLVCTSTRPVTGKEHVFKPYTVRKPVACQACWTRGFTKMQRCQGLWWLLMASADTTFQLFPRPRLEIYGSFLMRFLVSFVATVLLLSLDGRLRSNTRITPAHLSRTTWNADCKFHVHQACALGRPADCLTDMPQCDIHGKPLTSKVVRSKSNHVDPAATGADDSAEHSRVDVTSDELQKFSVQSPTSKALVRAASRNNTLMTTTSSVCAPTGLQYVGARS